MLLLAALPCRRCQLNHPGALVGSTGRPAYWLLPSLVLAGTGCQSEEKAGPVMARTLEQHCRGAVGTAPPGGRLPPTPTLDRLPLGLAGQQGPVPGCSRVAPGTRPEQSML